MNSKVIQAIRQTGFAIIFFSSKLELKKQFTEAKRGMLVPRVYNANTFNDSLQSRPAGIRHALSADHQLLILSHYSSLHYKEIAVICRV